MTWVAIASRNLLRNRRRSLLTLCAVALAFAAVNVFGGFTAYVFENLREAFIHSQANGHLQIYKRGYRERGASDPGAYFMSEVEFQKLRAFAAGEPRVLTMAGRIHLNGMLDADGVSTIFVGTAMTPSERDLIQRSAESIDVSADRFGDREIEDATPFAIEVSNGMAQNLGLGPGSTVILSAPTLDGMANAVDAEVYQVAQSVDQSLADKLVYMPLELAQNLFGTRGAAFICVLLSDRQELAAVKPALERYASDAGLDVEVLAWDELSVLFRHTKNMFNLIFGVVFAILGVIVGMSVMNTIGMAVMERTTEVGTLRAMGLKQRAVVRMFAIESALLGVVGCALGLIITIAVWFAVQILEPRWIPPSIGFSVRWEVLLVPEYLVMSFVALALLALAAAVLPARRAARTSIVDALGHV